MRHPVSDSWSVSANHECGSPGGIRTPAPSSEDRCSMRRDTSTGSQAKERTIMTTTRRTRLRVTGALLLALAALFVNPIHRLVGGAPLAGAASGGGTILFSRQNHWYTIAPNGTHLHLLLST